VPDSSRAAARDRRLQYASTVWVKWVPLWGVILVALRANVPMPGDLGGRRTPLGVG
jgi:hypothetical protein